MIAEPLRKAWVEVDLGALRANAASLSGMLGRTALCAVVKADAYGHGAVESARAFVSSGAALLAVALVEEGIELREAGIKSEILLLSEPTADALVEAVRHELTPTLYTEDGLSVVRREASADRPVTVQLKLDSGMHRVGADALVLGALAKSVAAAPECRLGGIWTHFAVADDLADEFTNGQLDALVFFATALRDDGIDPGLLHAANSAGAIGHRAARLDLARVGIALYGHEPSPGFLAATAESNGGVVLAPALSLKARVHHVHSLDAGERTSYGLRYLLKEKSDIAAVPLGYHDGVPRALFDRGGEVLIGGVRRPIAGTVTMDQLLVDCGADSGVRTGDEVVLIGRQGSEEIPAEEWAERLGTIVYEVLCGIGARVPRRYVDSALAQASNPRS